MSPSVSLKYPARGNRFRAPGLDRKLRNAPHRYGRLWLPAADGAQGSDDQDGDDPEVAPRATGHCRKPHWHLIHVSLWVGGGSEGRGDSTEYVSPSPSEGGMIRPPWVWPFRSGTGKAESG